MKCLENKMHVYMFPSIAAIFLSFNVFLLLQLPAPPHPPPPADCDINCTELGADWDSNCTEDKNNQLTCQRLWQRTFVYFHLNLHSLDEYKGTVVIPKMETISRKSPNSL